jgi:small ligand-binding sensory domain FIST
LCGEGDGDFLLIFYDSIKVPPTATTPPIMNASPLIIKGIEEALKPSIPILGAGLIGDFDFNPPRQFCGSHAGSQLVVGTLLGGELHHYHQIMHGCTPKDGIYHTITKIEGAVIYEVDGRPIVDTIDEMYGNQDWQKQIPVKRLTIGVHYGAKYREYKEGEYVNRLIAGVLPEGKGIVIFEPDLEVGTEILFMLRDSNQMMESTEQNTAKLLAQIKADGRKPVFGLYIDCAGRAAGFSETLTEEASEVRALFNQSGIPLLGFYSGVEVAPLLGKSRGLDWTGVLWVVATE